MHPHTMEDQERSNAQNADFGTHIEALLDTGMERAEVLPYRTLILQSER